MKILVLGASGMLGNAVFRYLFANSVYETFGSIRSTHALSFFTEAQQANLLTSVDVEKIDNLNLALATLKPDIVINCIGLVKQLSQANDPLSILPINAVLPHRLARLCAMVGARLIHISTDCVFSGSRGNYTEQDFADADDLYGRSKCLGEVSHDVHAVTLRTSIIGHELDSQHGLLNWFLAQQGEVKGFTQAIFSGLPTVELARVISEFVLPNINLAGVYHVASKPISKYDLLQLVSSVYRKQITIIPDSRLVIDRSLDASKFCAATGYQSPDWPELIVSMRAFA